MKIGVSHCLIGANCNFNGKDLLSAFVKQLEDSEQIQLIPFCPEDSIFGTPRPNMRIVGGDGFDVLDAPFHGAGRVGHHFVQAVGGAAKIGHCHPHILYALVDFFAVF